MQEWQPIETAPRDGTKIDILVKGKRHCNVHWSFSRDEDGNPLIDPCWDMWAYDGYSGMSYTPNGVSDWRDASHWMPLPPPPKK